MLPGRPSCYISGCEQAVVKQCPGFHASCGRLYCSQHSAGTLCLVCDRRKREYDAVQDLISDYIRTAETIPQHPAAGAAVQAVLVWGLIALVGSAILPAASFISLLGGAVISFIFWTAQTKSRTAAINNRIEEITRVMPQFKEFYAYWLQHTNPSAEEITSGIMGSGAALAGVGIIAALAISSSYPDHGS